MLYWFENFFLYLLKFFKLFTTHYYFFKLWKFSKCLTLDRYNILTDCYRVQFLCIIKSFCSNNFYVIADNNFLYCFVLQESSADVHWLVRGLHGRRHQGGTGGNPVQAGLS